LPGYQFCGPGIKLAERLKRGDKGSNPLDAACREHDIAYSQFKDLKNRHQADDILSCLQTLRTAHHHSFCTVSDEAALVVAGTIPIDLLAAE